jgi:hypothetical protein
MPRTDMMLPTHLFRIRTSESQSGHIDACGADEDSSCSLRMTMRGQERVAIRRHHGRDTPLRGAPPQPRCVIPPIFASSSPAKQDPPVAASKGGPDAALILKPRRKGHLRSDIPADQLG